MAYSDVFRYLEPGDADRLMAEHAMFAIVRCDECGSSDGPVRRCSTCGALLCVGCCPTHADARRNELLPAFISVAEDSALATTLRLGQAAIAAANAELADPAQSCGSPGCECGGVA